MDETIRQTYNRMVKARHAQLKRISDLGMKNREFGFVVTPGLVLQFNYVHRLVSSFRSGMPADICAEDGGVTCSNMSAMKSVTTRVESREPVGNTDSGYGSDYLTTRIIDLLDRPVYCGDQCNMTVNVRDEFAANIRTMSLLFEERYRLCQEQGDRLSDELATVRQQLAASREAAAAKSAFSKTTKTSDDRIVKELQEQITRHEAQLEVVRSRMESLRDSSENSITQDRREIETLLQRLARSGGRNANNQTLLKLLQGFIESQETERAELKAAVRHVELVFGQTSKRFVQSISKDVSTIKETKSQHTVSPRDEFERSVQLAVTDRVKKSLEDRAQQIESHVNSQVNARSLEFDQRLRAELETEYVARKAEQQRHFDERVKAEILRVFGGGAVPVVSVKPNRDRGSNEIKRVFDEVFSLHDFTDPVPTPEVLVRPVYLHRPFDEAVYSMYNCIEDLSKAAREIFKVLFVQSTGLENLSTAAVEDYVPIEYMSKELADKLLTQTKRVIDIYAKTLPNKVNEIMTLFDDIIDYITSLKSSLDEYFRLIQLANRVENNRRYYQPPTITDLQHDEQALMTHYTKYHQEGLNEEERRDLESIRAEVSKYDLEISKLHETHTANGTADLDHVKDYFVERPLMNAAFSLEKSKRNGLLIDFRRLYNDLAFFVIGFGTDFKRIYRETTPTILPPNLLRGHIESLNRLFDEADKTINFGYSPRPGKDLADIVPSLEYFITQSFEVPVSSVDDRPPGRNASHSSDDKLEAASSRSDNTSFKNRRREDRWRESTNR